MYVNGVLADVGCFRISCDLFVLFVFVLLSLSPQLLEAVY